MTEATSKDGLEEVLIEGQGSIEPLTRELTERPVRLRSPGATRNWKDDFERLSPKAVTTFG